MDQFNQRDKGLSIKWFRDATPYINAHRDKTFVIHLSGDVLEHPNFPGIIQDVMLLASLGVRLILVHGARKQIDKALNERGAPIKMQAGLRVTTPQTLQQVQSIVGRLRADFEARISRVATSISPTNHQTMIVSGNFISARPVGIIEGVDLEYTGAVRKVNVTAINQQLDSGAIVLISPLGYSPSGECFNLDSLNLAFEIAAGSLADKFILLSERAGLTGHDGVVISEIEGTQSPATLVKSEDIALLNLALKANLRGVERCHIVSYLDEDGLLRELFTRQGSGTQVVRASTEKIRKANAEDVGGIESLIRPLEEQGKLVRRTRELLESEVSHFTVIERDGLILACGALYPFGSSAELACLATHDEYRRGGRGDRILAEILREANNQQLKQLFVLTTQSAHWFAERGFHEGNIEELPSARRGLYNYERGSKFLFKNL